MTTEEAAPTDDAEPEPGAPETPEAALTDASEPSAVIGATDAAEAPAGTGAAGADEPPDVTGAPAPSRYIANLRRTRKVLWIAVAVAVPVTMLILVLATRPSAESKIVESPLLGKPAPAAEGTTVDGQKASVADFRGRWVVVNFFATWCVPCREEHPDLISFQDTHRQAGDATIVGVVYSDSVSAVRDFRAKEGGDWPMLTDPKGRIALDYGVGGVPESFLIDPNGIIVSKILGGVRAPDLQRLVDEAQLRSGGGG